MKQENWNGGFDNQHLCDGTHEYGRAEQQSGAYYGSHGPSFESALLDGDELEQHR